MKKAADASSASAIDLRFGQVGVLQVRLRSTNQGAILDELSGRIATAPQFFQNTGVCLDLSALEQEPDEVEIRGVIEAVRRAGMLTVGLSDASRHAESLAPVLSLPVLGGFRQASRPPPDAAKTAKAPEAVAPAGVPALQHHQPVRSGQRLYGRDRDLVVTAMVGAGAEVMADGCVHIYGALRGRAMAGVRGDATARVFCQEFRAELVAIAGVFRVFETLPADLEGQPVQAWLDGEELRFTRIGS
jgi:septum site-determining protein MinC